MNPKLIDYFANQMVKTKPLTNENISKMFTNRLDSYAKINKPVPTDNTLTPKSFFGTYYEEGDLVLYFFEIKNHLDKRVDMYGKSIVLRDIPKLESNYVFVKMNDHIPVLEKKK